MPTVTQASTATPIPSTPTPPPPPQGGVLLNELLTNPRQVNWDGSGTPTQAQWIELYNPTDSTISLAYWRITTANQATPAVLPAGQSIGSHSYLVLFKRDLGLDLAQGAVSLLDPNGNTVDSVSPPVLPPDQSYARIPDGSANWQVDGSPTLGGSNILLTGPMATPDLEATVFAIQTQVAGPLPSPPVAPQLDDGSLDATDLANGRRQPVRSRKGQAFRTLSISDVRDLPDDTPVITTGVVTMPTGLWDAARAYIQANGSGILIHGFGATSLHLGDTLTIKGRIHHLRGEVEVAAVKDGEQVTPGGAMPAPRTIAPGAVGSGTEALLVQVSGHVASVARDYATIADDAGSAPLYLYSRLALPAGSLKVGDMASITGVVNAAEATAGPSTRTYAQRVLTATHRLVPRLAGDLVVGGVPLGPTAAASEPLSSRRRPSSSARPGAGGTGTGSQTSQPAEAIATPTAFVTPALAGHEAAAGSTGAPTPASNVLLLQDRSSSGPPPWIWICVGLGLGLIVGGAGVALAPRLRGKKEG
ncbi:MAG TPA: lamin tail domain-containing protein [Chloroflexota bacterium]|nr:lamin tail domain-containing protein [Chloroflexota bacterium]